MEIRKQFKAKYGKKFEEAALMNTGGILNERVVTRLSVQPPAAGLVQTYLEKICSKYEVDWSPVAQLSPAEMGAVRTFLPWKMAGGSYVVTSRFSYQQFVFSLSI